MTERPGLLPLGPGFLHPDGARDHRRTQGGPVHRRPRPRRRRFPPTLPPTKPTGQGGRLSFRVAKPSWRAALRSRRDRAERHRSAAIPPRSTRQCGSPIIRTRAPDGAPHSPCPSGMPPNRPPGRGRCRSACGAGERIEEARGRVDRPTGPPPASQPNREACSSRALTLGSGAFGWRMRSDPSSRTGCGRRSCINRFET